jgi:hypothetical protein
MVAGRVVRQVERQPAVAAQTPVPADAVGHPCKGRIDRPDLSRVGPDELVAEKAADKKLVMEARPKSARLGDAWKAATLAFFVQRASFLFDFAAA